MPYKTARRTSYRRKATKGKKPVVVRVAPKKKAVPKKKTINRKTNMNKRAINVLASNQRLIDKFLLTKVSNSYVQYKNIAESFDTNSSSPGASKLIFDDTLTNTLPMHLYALTSCPSTADVTPRARLDLNTDCINFNIPSNSQYEKTSQTGYHPEPDTSQWKNRFNIHRYVNAKICLWGREAYRTNYTVKLIKLYDSDLDPFDTEGSSLSSLQSYTRSAFYGTLMKSKVSNPIVTSQHHLGSFKGKYKVLWSKTYSIPERLSTQDQMPHKVVRIFRQTDSLLDYGSEARLANIGQLDNPESALTTNENYGVVRNEPRQNQRLYLMVTANITKSLSEGATDADWGSYDISITNKFSALGAN